MKTAKSYHARSGGMDRVERETIITKDEILNLKIALATCQDVLEFVADEHIFQRI
jgi:hypothetical protein